MSAAFQMLNTVVTTLKGILVAVVSVSSNMHLLLLLDLPQRAWSYLPDLNPE